MSSQDQADRDLSIPAQWAAIHEYAARKSLTIVRQFEDIESAKEPGRTAFTEMMEALRKDGRVAGVICHKVDRLTRKLKDFALIDDFIQAGVDFHFVTGNFDRSPAGKLGLGIQALFAKHYLDNLSEEVMKGLQQRLRVQRRWAFPAPLGYRYQGIEKEAEIVPDPERFPLVQKGWQLLSNGQYSLADVTDRLYRLGLRSRGNKRYPGGVKVTKSTLSKLFTNPFYYGMMRWRGEVMPGAHQPMISKQLFDQCQAILHNRGNPRPVLKSFTYRGFLVCGECGSAVTAEEHKRYVYYRCTKWRGAQTCRQRYVREEVLEEQFAEQLAAMEIDEIATEVLRRALKEFHAHEQDYRRTSLEGLRRRSDEVQKKKDVLMDKYLEQVVPEEAWKRKFGQLCDELTLVEHEIAALETAQDRFFETADLLL